jgi:hypothetical protein
MQTIQEVNAEQLAKLFHHYHEALQHDCDSEGDGFSWDRAPQSERKLMIAAARLALLELSTTAETPNPHRKYYAKAEKLTGAAKSRNWSRCPNGVTRRILFTKSL